VFISALIIVPPNSDILIKMGLYCVGARRAVPLHYEATTVSLTETMAETMIKTNLQVASLTK